MLFVVRKKRLIFVGNFKKMSVLTLQLPDEIVQEFEQLVSAEKQSRENVFIKALRLYMYQKNAAKIRRSLRPYAEKAGIHTEEDLFNHLS